MDSSLNQYSPVAEAEEKMGHGFAQTLEPKFFCTGISETETNQN